MFYQGDLQSGIGLAVREAKPVVCFVRDDQDESAKWENEYFDDDLSQLLSDKSVTLRLTAGTQEAGFLTSICPIQAFPAVLVIMNGLVQDYIAAGTSKDDFQTRLRAAVVTRNAQQQQQTPSQQGATTTNTEADVNQRPPVAPANVPAEPASQPRQVPIEQRPVETAQPTRQTTQQNQTDQKEKDRRALQLKLQREKREQKEERERIRNQIKQDQEARKQRSAEERNRSMAAAAEAEVNTAVPAARNTTASTRKPVSEYRLQVRLFDGSSVRASFPLAATIRKDIRPWIESHRGGDSQPYNLKHILTPLPNHTISAAEEERALEEIGLGPTASLVMVPVPSYIEAYASPSLADSLPGRAVSAGYGLVSGVVGGAAGLVGSFLGYGASSTSTPATTSSDNPDQPTPASSRSTPRTGGGINIRTLRDQREEQDKNEFYNGNTLNFEPKRNDDHKND
ncbi:hypothetical protein PISL3812_00309 [Talaromyces islandicus]|uniref:UBX domain-containing protein n=1 Tax=Talaromyces islandicus TaxID=28573 RepID=A0A0U1LJL4_TALIS|nr:hypothetical protein PISL3812_00309 [Talaromyces islandicus]